MHGLWPLLDFTEKIERHERANCFFIISFTSVSAEYQFARAKNFEIFSREIEVGSSESNGTSNCLCEFCKDQRMPFEIINISTKHILHIKLVHMYFFLQKHAGHLWRVPGNYWFNTQ